MKITVTYDNEAKKEGLSAGWGFSAFIESEKWPPILFDTGADGPALVHNMKQLNIDPTIIGTIVISHAHGDHTGGLSKILEINNKAEIYVPVSTVARLPGRKVVYVKEPIQLREDVFSTGELEGIEQSLALRTEKGVFVLTGCAHPSLRKILGAASKFGKPYGIAGGFHGFHDFELFEDLSLIYPCHCTRYKDEILSLFPGRASICGVGLEIDL